MAWRLVKQPNGLFGVFSEIVDNFTQINLSELEASNYCAERGLNSFESQQKIDSSSWELGWINSNITIPGFTVRFICQRERALILLD